VAKGFYKTVVISLWLCSSAMLGGCVLRSLTIDSQPSGAIVYLDDELIGETPVTAPFTYYGTRKITLEKVDAEGRLIYERKIVYEKIKPPYYQILPLDFFAELIIPAKLKDEHYFTYQLDPIQETPKAERQKELMKNAEELRGRLANPVTH
jgi:hypothetical protein